MAFTITTSRTAAPKFKQNLAGLHDRFEKAFTAAMNMAAAMIKQQSDADIAGAGNFGSKWTNSLKVEVVNRNRITSTLDMEGASIFAKGGIIKGNPMLWIPISGTNAVGTQAKNYPGGLFSVNRKAGGAPLLFSIADKTPKYFGIESVTIPKKFHLGEIQKSVMANFRSIFDTAFKAAE
jgi:hypothetical protein